MWFLTVLVNTRAGQGVLLVLGVLIALVAVLQPSWAMDPLRGAAEEVLLRFGAGILPVAVWALAVLLVWRYRWTLLFRRWRWVLGSAALVAAVQGALAFFEGTMPLVGTANLGGEYGVAIQGQSTLQGYLRVGALGVLGLWVLLPRSAVGPRLLRGGAGSLFLRTAYGLGLLVRVFILAVRFVLRLPRATLALLPGRRRARSAAQLAKDLSSYMSATASQAPPPARQPSEPSGTGVRRAPVRAEEVVADTPLPSPELELRSPASSTPLGHQNDGWPLPPAGLLRPAEAIMVHEGEHEATAHLMEETLAQHGVEVRVAEIRAGPTVTLFGLVPGWTRRGRGSAPEAERPMDETDDPDTVTPSLGNRVKVDSILAREKDLALALAAPSLRIQAPVPGEHIVGVEVPNRYPSTVTIRSVMESDAYRRTLERGGLPVALGQASAGETIAIDLVNMPHLLIAGATGSGKSVCISSIITSIISHQQPSEVRLLLVDPKRVELTPYNGIPHLVTPVVVEPERTVLLLRGAIQEMLRRYRLLEEAGVRNVQSYNRSARAHEPIPYLVVCIDELADLMMTSSYVVEQVICRLAQLGRATGIHLVVATQRPSVDVVTGLIKANFPSRISFAVASQVDSRTILDTGGAERLLGRGDMLFLTPGSVKPRRVQGAYISEEETEALVDHWRQHHGPPVDKIPLEALAQQAERVTDETSNTEHRDGSQDSLFDKAMDLARRNRQISTSLLQRRLRIGYPRAARLMDQLEDEGIVAPGTEPGKPRDVIFPPPDQA